MKTSARSSRQAVAKPRLERLEDRLTPDTTAMLISGTLYVSGDANRNLIDVTANSGNLVVTDHGNVIGSFVSSSVTGIAIHSGDGNDVVKIDPSVLQPATIEGGAGHDILQAGGGPTTLIAGLGPTKLVGGAANDLLVAGGPGDVLIARGGQDTLQAGPGHDKLYTGGTAVVLGTQASDQVFAQAPAPIPADPPVDPALVDSPANQLTTAEVNTILERAAAATPADDGIVVITDREGNVLGVRVESHVSPVITGSTANLVFAIDGALALARTGAFFGNSLPGGAPLTSRTIEFISQTTITQREVQSNPSIADTSSTLRGPGFVAPIGIGGHFPPNIAFTPQVDLFGIEATNRDVGTPRFGASFDTGQAVPAPESYGVISGLMPTALARGIGTLPGGVPIYRHGAIVGGIGVFFPGTTGYATEENSSLNQALYDPTKPDRSLEAELIAFAAVGGSSTASSCNRPVGAFAFDNAFGPALALPSYFDLPSGNINLVGVSLDIFGPGGRMGPDVLADLGNRLGLGKGDPLSGIDEPIDPVGHLLAAGTAVPTGWLVSPMDDPLHGGLTAADVDRIITQGIQEAVQIRAAIRLPLDSTAEMVFAVTNKVGTILGLYRMPDATYFSIAVAVAKARNVAYYDDPAQLQTVDKLPGIAAGVSFTNRTFRYLAEPTFPEGINGMPPAPFSILNDGGVNLQTGADVGPPLPASAFTSIMGHDVFNPNTNFHDPLVPGENENGIVFFPGSTALYKHGSIVGGLGVSGDGVDQDDDVTYFASIGYQPTPNGATRSDQVYFDGLLLPYQNFNRNPVEPV